MIEQTPQFQKLLHENRRIKKIMLRQRDRNNDLQRQVKQLQREAEIDRKRMIAVSNMINEMHVHIPKIINGKMKL